MASGHRIRRNAQEVARRFNGFIKTSAKDNTKITVGLVTMAGTTSVLDLLIIRERKLVSLKLVCGNNLRNLSVCLYGTSMPPCDKSAL